MDKSPRVSEELAKKVLKESNKDDRGTTRKDALTEDISRDCYDSWSGNFSGLYDENLKLKVLELLGLISGDDLKDDKIRKLLKDIGEYAVFRVTRYSDLGRDESEEEFKKMFDLIPQELHEDIINKATSQSFSTDVGCTAEYIEEDRKNGEDISSDKLSERRLEPFKKFKFSPFYTRDRLKLAVGIAIQSYTQITEEMKDVLRIGSGLTDEEFVDSVIIGINYTLSEEQIYSNLNSAIRRYAEDFNITEKEIFSRLSEDVKKTIVSNSANQFIGSLGYNSDDIWWYIEDGYLSDDDFDPLYVMNHIGELYLSGGELNEKQLLFVLSIVDKKDVDEICKNAKRIRDTGTKNPYLFKILEQKGWQVSAINTVIDFFSNIPKEDEYADNFRYARKNNPQEVVEYKEKADAGCCGSHDTEIKTDEGVVLVGYNYGH